MNKLTIGLIGIGNIVKRHLVALKANPEYELIGVCRRSTEKLKKQAAELGIKGCANYRDLLAEKPDVVLISLPHHLHYPVAMDALKAGCHILMEKPIAISMSEVNDLIRAAAHANRIIVPVDSSYWLPLYRAARKIVQSGKLGKLLFGNFTNHRFYYNEDRPDWFLKSRSSGGGQFMNIGVHRVSGIRCILGDSYEEMSVTASAHWIHPDYDIESAVKAMVMYDDGVAMTYEECGYLQPPSELARSLHFVFENGLLGVTDGKVWTSDREGGITYHDLAPEPAGGVYGAIYAQMLKGIRGESYYPTFHHGAADVRIALAAYASAKQRTSINFSDSAWIIAGGK